MAEQDSPNSRELAICDPEHFETVRRGKEAIDQWRSEHSFPEYLQLAGADLRGARLMGANLQCACLEGADLSFADLRDAILSGAHLKDAKLESADLRDAHLECADLERANLSWAHLERAVLNSARIERVDLRNANLDAASLMYAKLEGALLQRTNLSNAVLLDVGVVPLWRRILMPWEYPFYLDQTRVRDVRFESAVSDPWSILRRNYTGPQFALHLLFLILFALPYFARALYWNGVNEVQDIGFKAAVSQVGLAAGHLRDSRDPVAQRWIEQADQFLQRYSPTGDVAGPAGGRAAAYRELRHLLQSAAELKPPGGLLEPAPLATLSKAQLAQHLWAAEAGKLLDLYGPLLRDDSTQWPLWALLLGWDKGAWYFLLVLWPVLLYNLLRAWLTYKVSRLRDMEERSGYSPQWREYRPLYWLHQPARLLMLVAFGSFAYNAWHWLTATVIVTS